MQNGWAIYNLFAWIQEGMTQPVLSTSNIAFLAHFNEHFIPREAVTFRKPGWIWLVEICKVGCTKPLVDWLICEEKRERPNQHWAVYSESLYFGVMRSIIRLKEESIP